MLSSRRAVQWMANETSLHASRARGEGPDYRRAHKGRDGVARNRIGDIQVRGSLLQLSSKGDGSAGEPLPPQTGRARALSRASNTRNEGSTPSAPAKMIQVGTFRGMPVFVDDATGNVVDENWWPDTTVNGHPPTTT